MVFIAYRKECNRHVSLTRVSRIGGHSTPLQLGQASINTPDLNLKWGRFQAEVPPPPHLEFWSGGDFSFPGMAACKVEAQVRGVHAGLTQLYAMPSRQEECYNIIFLGTSKLWTLIRIYVHTLHIVHMIWGLGGLRQSRYRHGPNYWC